MQKKVRIKTQVHKVLYQALEIERGSLRIYQTALACAQTSARKVELEEHLEQARAHELVLLKMFEELGLDPDANERYTDAEREADDASVILVEDTELPSREQIEPLTDQAKAEKTRAAQAKNLRDRLLK